MPKRAAIYARISSDPQGLRAGVERQEADCRGLIKSRGWKLAGLYCDNDTSAWNGKARPEYQRLLGDIEGQALDAVVVWHLDRLHRSPRELEEFIDLCQRAGMSDVATVTGDLDIAESDGLFQARILTAVARKSSDDSARRLRRKMEDIAREGRPGGGGKRAFGFERDGVAVRKDEARIVREAVKRALAGEGLFAIASEFNRRGVPTVSGGLWSTRSLKRILTSPRWAGLRDYKGVVVAEAVWPAIIKRADWEKLRILLLDPGRSNGSTTARKYLLPGLIFCGLCEARMVSRPRRARGQLENRRSYACTTQVYDGCGKVSIVADEIEAFVRDVVFEALDSPEFVQAIRAVEGDDEEQRGLLETLRDDETALEQLARDHYADRLISRAEFLEARKAIEGRIESTQRSLGRSAKASVLSNLPSTRDALEKAWETRDLSWRRAVLSALIEKVSISPAVRGRNYFDPNRIEVTWRV